MPLEAVKNKMRLEGVDENLLNNPSINSESVEAGAYNPAIEKYRKMLKAGVPEEAVKAKMIIDGADPNLLHSSITSTMAPHALTISKLTSKIPLPNNLRKYAIMLKNDIGQVEAVKQKMTADGVCPKDQEKLIASVKQMSPLSSMSNKSPKKREITPPKKTVAPKMLGLHWEPLVEDKIQETVWSSILPSGEKVALESQHMDQLMSMFGLKKATDAKAAGKPVTEGKVSIKSGKKASNALTVIDTGRSTNIAIGLTAFRGRGLTAANVAHAIDFLDIKTLSLDDIQRVKEMLPSDTEAKSLKGKDFGSLHDAEKCLFVFAEVKNIKAKLQCMAFVSSACTHGREIGLGVSLVREAAGRALLSKGLQEVMKSVLAIGNAMNEGTWKGGAAGFKLSGLSKLHQVQVDQNLLFCLM